MALTQGQLNFIEILGRQSQALLELFPEAVLINVQWNGAPDYDADITQPEIEAESRLAEIGLELTDLQEVAYIVAILQNEMTSRIDHLAKLAQLA